MQKGRVFKGMVLFNYIDFINAALINFLNDVSSDTVLNAKGKLFIKSNRKNEQLLSFFLESQIKNNLYFGKKTVLFNTCSPVNNWRNEDKKISERSRFKIADDSIYFDEGDMNYFFENEFNRIGKKFKNKLLTIEFSLLDIDDLKQIIKINFNKDFVKINEYNIIEDGNNIFKTEQKIGNFLYEDVKFVFGNLGLIIN
jgi:hypothetical protein